jgi:hypothetical protein
MIHRCKSPFSTRVKGMPRVVAAGELVDDSDPVFKGREHLFESVDVYVERVDKKRVSNVTVESATANPGEVRQVTKPRKPRKASEPSESE